MSLTLQEVQAVHSCINYQVITIRALEKLTLKQDVGNEAFQSFRSAFTKEPIKPS